MSQLLTRSIHYHQLLSISINVIAVLFKTNVITYILITSYSIVIITILQSSLKSSCTFSHAVIQCIRTQEKYKKQTIIQQPSSQSRGTICPIVQVLNKQTCKQMTKLATSFCVIIIIILCRSKQPKTLMYNVFHASANLRSGDVQLINFYIKSRCYQSKLPSPFDTFYQAII